MTVTDVRKSTEALTMTVTAQFDAPMARVWQLWEDPRLLERWWGPPTHPATFVDHDLSPGGRMSYYMTGPEGDQHWGWWRVLVVDAPRHIEFEDGFSDESGNPLDDMPAMVMRVDLGDSAEGGTVMTIETEFPSTEAMEQILAMGAEEGMMQALGQIDQILKTEAAAQ